MRIMCALAALLISQSLLGCQGISPSVKQAQDEAAKAAQRYRDGYNGVVKTYLTDYGKLLQLVAFTAAKADLAAGTKPNEALDKLQAALNKIASKLEQIRDEATKNEENYRTWLVLTEEVGEVLSELERRKTAEDGLADATKRAAVEVTKRAKRGGF